VRAAVNKRESEVSDGFKKYSAMRPDAELGERCLDACKPIADEMQARGLDPAAVLAEFVVAHLGLQSPQAPAVIEHLVRRFNVPVTVLQLPPKGM
jgi:hypothetical protein